MTMNDCPGGKLAYARGLAEQLDKRPVPEDFDWGTRPFAVTMADLRHAATNYDELLIQLREFCFECPNGKEAGDTLCPIGRMPAEDGMHDTVGQALDEAAHDILKEVAYWLAREIYGR